LAEVQQMPDLLGKDQPIHRAKMMIAPINKYIDGYHSSYIHSLGIRGRAWGD
jgi:hypothetical protein